MFTESLPSNDRMDTHTAPETDERHFNYATEIGSGAMKYKPSSIKTSLGIQKLIWGIHRQHGDRISLLSSFKMRKVG
jgi:hypothetical protein